MRYFFGISYKGTDFHGWQRQKNAVSIQEIVEARLSIILREEISITASGRTDKGVHCRKQYFHTDIEGEFEEKDLIYKLNSFLPDTIVIHTIEKVDDQANARFDAIERVYEYFISREKNPFLLDTSLYVPGPLDITVMNSAAALLIGKQDFTSFSKVKTDVNTFICTVMEASWIQEGEMIVFRISANRFLRGMVRALVGTMLEVGQGKRDYHAIRDILQAKDRKVAGPAVAPGGLFLADVKYPEGLIKRET